MIKNREEDFIKRFGKNLKRIRKSKNVSQETLAIRVDTSRSQIARIERGEINPTISTVYKFSQALNVDVHHLFQFEK